MIFLRSLLFNFCFIVWTFLCTIYAVLVSVFGRMPLMYTARTWGVGVQVMLKHIINLTTEFQDRHHIPQSGPYILACKHQSAWDTTIIQILCFDSSIILKRELMLIPLFGQVLKIAGAISVSRRKGRSVLLALIAGAKTQVQMGRPLFIFPEGTRSQPGQAGQYRSGVYALYHHLNLPVIPAALNSGCFWPRRGFLKYPGHITLRVLPPIQPGLKQDVFMAKLRESIDEASQNLFQTVPHNQNISLSKNHEYSQ
jgi:1-acyl-sn-glycerol-3-phosphate acyltransferase